MSTQVLVGQCRFFLARLYYGSAISDLNGQHATLDPKVVSVIQTMYKGWGTFGEDLKKALDCKHERAFRKRCRKIWAIYFDSELLVVSVFRDRGCDPRGNSQLYRSYKGLPEVLQKCYGVPYNLYLAAMFDPDINTFVPFNELHAFKIATYYGFVRRLKKKSDDFEKKFIEIVE